MATVAVAVPPQPLLIDLGDVQQSESAPLGTPLDMSSENDDPDASADSDFEVTTPLSVLAEQEKRLSQKAAFHNFLQESKKHDQGTDEEDVRTNSSSSEAGRARRIIDEVRKYQQELFERALEENIIAVLDTGSGKTLIACLLVRHVLSEEVKNRGQGKPPRIVFFLACSVHLVQQQARVLANNLIQRPYVFVGSDKADIWKDRDLWPKVIEDSTPVVCTPAVLQQCLDSALITIDQISLLVFDEAHHAKKNHPYSRIIRSHYLKCDVSQRPRIFGMTASPVDSKKNVDVSTADLEDILHCKIVTAQDPSKLSFVPKPEDVIWKYQKLRPSFETDLCMLLRAKCGHLEEAKRGFRFAKDATSTLGLWCADRVWKFVIGASEHQAAGIIKRFEQSPAYIDLERVEERESAMQNLQEAVMMVLSHDSSYPIADSIHLSPKVLLLYRKLYETFSQRPNTRAIVFVDQRFTAQVLYDLFNRLGVPNLRPGTLLGTASDSTSMAKQQVFLDQFRAGLINLIFATSVADEGIDIPQCNLCVRFDLYKSPIQYIQSRGRARMTNSVYAHMVEEDNIQHETELKFAINSDKYIKEYCEKLEPNRLLGRGTKLERLIARDSSCKSFKTSAGVVCDYDNAQLVVSRFASSLTHLGAVEKESYEEEIDEANKLFRYVVRLPKVTEVEVQGARGEWRPNKALARRSAAWNCCVKLRRKCILDEKLDSPFRKVKPGNLNARLAISDKTSAYPMTIKPSVWQDGLGKKPSELYLSVVYLKPQRTLRRQHAPIAVFTRTRLPTFPNFTLYLEDGVETQVLVISRSDCFLISPEELEILTNFTLDGVFLDVFNKSYEPDSTRLSYWLAPVVDQPDISHEDLGEIIDMNAMRVVQQGRAKWPSAGPVESTWTKKFICDPLNGMYHYFTDDVVPGVCIFDPVPATVPSLSQKGMKNIIDFSNSYWRGSKKNFIEATYDPDQPVIAAELVVARRNFLDRDLANNQIPVECLIAPQPLEVSRLHPSFAASCILWPSIIHRLESYMIALEAFEQLNLHGVPAELALEAFTKGSDAEDQEHQVHTEAHRGSGKNYERLEFIGDSLLKMMTTITVFNRTKCDEEGMHCRRMEILCNKRLFEVSTQKYHLYRFARTSPFNRATWYPENVILLKGRGAGKTPEPVKHPEVGQQLGMKTIADISEAIIGAAVVSSKNSLYQLDLGIEAITKLVDSEDHNLTSWSQIASMYEPLEWSLKTNDIQANKLAEDVAARTGYHFNHPRLLRSAFTHSSDVHATVPDLQRLEFLGDAVLDWVCVSWLFDTNPDRNPQWLTEHKMAMVSNKFLAALAVILDFDKFIYCSTTKLYADITFYAKRVRDMFTANDVDPDFWVNIDSAPKALSDLVESYLGAVLVDSNFNYDEVEKFFNKHVLWFFKDINKYDSFASRHPTTFLYKKLTDEFKCRDHRVLASDTDEGMVERRVTAGVLIHNKVIADSSGTSAKYAKVRASQAALAKLEGMTIEDFKRIYGCYCKLRED